jgi:hypothetical protein
VIPLPETKGGEDTFERETEPEKEEQDQTPEKALRLVPLASLIIQILELLLKLIGIIK